MCIDMCPINTLPKKISLLPRFPLLSVCLQSLFPLVDLSTCADLSFVISFYSKRQGQTDLCKHFKLNQAALSQFFFPSTLLSTIASLLFSVFTLKHLQPDGEILWFLSISACTHIQRTHNQTINVHVNCSFFISICIKGESYVAVTKLF